MTTAVRRVVDPLTDYLHDEAAGGVALLVGAVAALLWANLDGAGYEAFWSTGLAGEDLGHWVNDGLMVLFFFMVGVEIKRELVTGELADRRAATLPAIAAVGGVAVPALMFFALTAGTPSADGWAIPAATDIAFAVGVIALLGDRVPAGARLLLLSIAIVDDVLAIVIIALFYASGVSAAWLAGAAACVLVVLALRPFATSPWWYVLPGLALWWCVHESGVHATLAGVVLGLLTPARPIRGRDVRAEVEHRLHGWSAFLVVPVFALANAGIALSGDTLSDALAGPIFWGVGAGLVLGKLVGVSLGTWLALRLRVGTLPEGVGRREVLGVAALAGIGFTVSIFIAGLAYSDDALVERAKLGILAGSLVSALLGVALLLRARRSAPGGRAA